MSDPGGVQRALVTGGAGFIGSNLAERLLDAGVEVVVYDNFSTGQRRFVERVAASSGARVIEGDVLDASRLTEAMVGCDIVFHLAANADVRHGLEHPDRDLQQNTIGTFTVLNTMRAVGVRRVVFGSTGSVYGEPEIFPTPENCPFPQQTSLYAASKLAGEALLQAFCEGYGFSGVILRFVSIMGERYTHGHLFDFYRSLLLDPSYLYILGDGRQRKSYLYVGDCVDAILQLVAQHHDSGSTVYNLGSDEVTDVDRSVEAICRHLGVAPKTVYAGGARGWVGDSPHIHLDCARLRAFLRDVDAETARKSWAEAFARSCAEPCRLPAASIDRFLAAVPSVREGESSTLLFNERGMDFLMNGHLVGRVAHPVPVPYRIRKHQPGCDETCRAITAPFIDHL